MRFRLSVKNREHEYIDSQTITFPPKAFINLNLGRSPG